MKFPKSIIAQYLAAIGKRGGEAGKGVKRSGRPKGAKDSKPRKKRARKLTN